MAQDGGLVSKQLQEQGQGLGAAYTGQPNGSERAHVDGIGSRCVAFEHSQRRGGFPVCQ